MPLTDVAIRSAKPSTKPVRLFDGGGLYLEVSPTGGKLWRLKYRFGGKEKRLALGVYPQVSLAEAREKREQARKLLANDIDPGAQKRAEKTAKQERSANTFEKIAREWHGNRLDAWRPSTAQDAIRRLEIDIFLEIGAFPIADITHKQLIDALRRIDQRPFGAFVIQVVP